MKHPFFLLTFLLGASLCSAQTPPAPPAESEPVSLENFIVSASPFTRAQDEIALPTSVLAGRRLAFQRQATLGETLSAEPGVSSTYHGPGASRPVIRGLGGDRIRVLTGGIGTLDASVISPDHAVSLDPLLIERIEIVRGPATLLYGGSALGGVVNVIDGRIPEDLPDTPLGGRLEARAGSAADERAGAGVLHGAAGRFAWRLDGFERRTRDLRIPGHAETDALLASHDDEDNPPAHGRLPNSATHTRGAGLGVSFIGPRGHVGVSHTGLNSRYGVPGHAHGHHHEHDDHDEEEHGEEHGDVSLRLRQRRTDFHAEWLEPAGLLRAMKFQLGIARYRHDEFEGDEIGTRFRNRAHEGRIEWLHEPLGRFEGALGVQVSRSDLSALGAEAFVPPSVTTNRALFLYEELPGTRLTWQLGARLERQEIEPLAAGLPSRRHTGGSLAAGFVWRLNPEHTLALSATRSARAPNAQELYADGPHAGTGAYEVGDAGLRTERARGIDLSLRRRQGAVTGSLTVFVNDFDGFIFEEATGAEEDGLPVFAFVQRDARFQGVEAEVIFHLHETTGHRADVRVGLDHVRATERGAGALPRIPPARLFWAFDYRWGDWAFTAETRRTSRTTRFAAGETETAGHTLLNAYASRRLRQGRVETEFFIRGTNLLDQTARAHTSFLKDVAPLPGRDLSAGVRLVF